MGQRNPRTSRLLVMAGQDARSVRLSAADRAFLRDLARVRIIDRDTAMAAHYSPRAQGGAHSLRRLARAGLLTEKIVRVPGRDPLTTYEFRSRELAKAWGGDVPVTGARRTEWHEVITAKLYFALGRPSDFRVAADFTSKDRARCGHCMPDAFYTNGAGDVVAVEADSGHYTRRQIAHKQYQWALFGVQRQVWGQPDFTAAPLPPSASVEVFRF